MKTNFIRINDISEIDTSKATAYDLGNRYIDVKGQMYSLRYNRANKKIEIVHIIRTAAKNVSYFNKKMHQNRSSLNIKIEQKKNEADSISTTNEENPKTETSFSTNDQLLNENNQKTELGEELAFSPLIFLDEIPNLMDTHYERLSNLIINVEQAIDISDHYTTEKQRLNEMFRNLEIDCLKRIDDYKKLTKELTSYPRSLTYYTSKMDDSAKNIVDALTSNKEKLRFVKHYETLQALSIYQINATKNLNKVIGFLENVQNTNIGLIIPKKRIYLTDAIISLKTTQEELLELKVNIQQLTSYTSNPANYI